MVIDRSVLRGLGVLIAGAGIVAACSNTVDEIPPNQQDAATNDDASVGGDQDADVVAVDCTKAADCPSGVCNLGVHECEAPTCADGVANGDESDIDCGGACGPCDVAKKCTHAADCTSGVCSDKSDGADAGADAGSDAGPGTTGPVCQAPSSTDGVKNGTETGVDCGGTGNPKCADGEGCAEREDCTSDVCTDGKCIPASTKDGVQNGTETDVDCGGPAAPRCADHLKCADADDCTSGVCKAEAGVLRCQVPSPTDKVKNGTETDVDCGGAGNPTCKAGKACVAATDCASGGCNYAKRCAAARSCTVQYGGDTCGSGGEGGVGAKSWEDCCKSIEVTAPTTGKIYLDKYPVTAGRMRAFLTAVNYDVRKFVQDTRAANKIPAIPVNTSNVADGKNPTLAPDWDKYLPTSFAGDAKAGEIADCDQSNWDYTNQTCRTGVYTGVYTAVSRHLGGTIFRANSQTSTGCFVGSPGTHSFRFPNNAQDGETPEQDQNVYDTKTLNCVDYLVGQAFCIWDGGRLETFAEWQAAWGAEASNPYAAQTSTVPAKPNDRCKPDATCSGGNQSTTNSECNSAVDGETGSIYSCVSNKCCLAGGDNTWYGCRFPWATDANRGGDCGLTWPTTRSIEFADYWYSYEYPKSKYAGDYIVFLTAPGRTRGRGPLGHSDIIGTGFELTSSVNFNADPFAARHRWSGNGSWEVHDYTKGYNSSTMLLNKYGKLGLRCARPTTAE